MPASHGKQVEAPVRFMKRPELQLLQVLAAVPEIFPAEHSPQLLAPGLLAYVPGSQFVQLVDAALPANVPALQFVQSDARPPLNLPEGHTEQFSDAARLNLPESQSEHDVEPVTVLYVPAGQTGHSVSRFAANMALPGVQCAHAWPVST